MPENKEQQNVSDIVELVKAYGNSDAEEYEDIGIDSMTDDEVRDKLNQQLMSDGLNEMIKEVKISDTYAIDEDFLAEAEPEAVKELEEETEEELEEEPEEELDEETEEFFEEEIEPVPEEIDEDITFDEIDETEDEDDIPIVPVDLDDDDDITFDQLDVSEDEEDDIAVVPIILDDDDDDDVIFDEPEIAKTEDIAVVPIILDEEDDDIVDELEETTDEETELIPIFIEEETAADNDGTDESADINEAEDDITLMHLEAELFDEDAVHDINHGEGAEDEPEVVEENFLLRESRRIADEEAALLVGEESSDEIEAENSEEDTAEENFFDEIFTEGDIVISDTPDSPLETLAKSEYNGSEISLLLQLGCEEEVIEHYESESLNKINEEEALKDISGEEDESLEEQPEKGHKKSANEKIRSRYEYYMTRRGGLLFRIALCSVCAFLLILYEAIPYLFGVELPGIMNREDFFFSYVLLGLQLAVFCALPVYKRIFDGAKKLFSRSANAYSMVAAFAVPLLIYDIIIIFAKDNQFIPTTFHFAFACLIVFALVQECQAISAEKRSFEFYFADALANEEGSEEQKYFTLCKSEGKNSVAEKMYAGGSKSIRNLYFPIETDSTVGFISAVNNKSARADMPMVAIIPSFVVSLLVGAFAFIVSENIVVGLAGVLISLLLAMPIMTAITSWLPFERLSAKFENDGFAFASEGSIENYTDCNMVLFSDTLLFAKCSPSKVNLALYDATAKEVLLGCLSAVYDEIGGPMSETFAAAKNEKLGKCMIKRVAKSGIEAIVGSNYSVLVGSELFMSRYGIAFPNASLSNSEDGVFTLCVSINGRASARIAVRYAVNEMFLMFLHRLAEDGIECVVETFDPMITTELLKRLLPSEKTPISIVHLNAQDHSAKKDKGRDSIIFEASGGDLGVVAKHSKLNLHVALSAAKRMTKLRKAVNIFAIAFSGLGALIALAAAGFGWVEGFSQFYIILYWLLGAVAVFAITVRLLPSKDRYSYELYKAEREENNN